MIKNYASCTQSHVFVCDLSTIWANGQDLVCIMLNKPKQALANSSISLTYRATNIGFLTPSVTTYKGLNPSYRLYTIDGFEEGSSLVLLARRL